MLERAGGCLCGSIRYRLTAEPESAGICWCRDCQRLSSGGAVNAVFPDASIEIDGCPVEYASPGGSGEDVRRRFCPRCGSHLFSDLVRRLGSTVVRVGTLDDPSSITPAGYIWASSATSRACFDPALPRFDRNP